MNIGDKFGTRTIVSFSHRASNRKTYWNCICERCNTPQTVRIDRLKSNTCRECYRRSRRTERYGNEQVAYIHNNMMHRCYTPTHRAFALYGGRGIAVCKRWHAFANFITDMGIPPAGRSLDRIDNDGDYCPQNCRWATRTEQANNRRTNRTLTINGVTRTIAQWSKQSGVNKATIRSRKERAWCDSCAVSLTIGDTCHHCTPAN